MQGGRGRKTAKVFVVERIALDIVPMGMSIKLSRYWIWNLGPVLVNCLFDANSKMIGFKKCRKFLKSV